MKDFKIWTFFSALWLTIITAVVSGVAALAYDDTGYTGGFMGIIFFIIAHVFWLLEFPFVLLLYGVKNPENLLYLALAADIIFWSLLIERLFYLRRRKKKVIDPLH